MGHIGQGPAGLGTYHPRTSLPRTQNSRRYDQGHIGQGRIVMSATIVPCSDSILLCSNLSKTYQRHLWFQDTSRGVPVTNKITNSTIYEISTFLFSYILTKYGQKLHDDSLQKYRKDLVIY